jgi:hypothetical protein
MTTEVTEPSEIHAGDWLELRGVGDRPVRRGQIIGLLGRPEHPHFRVRWDDEQESLVYPADHAFRVLRLHANAPAAAHNA